MPIPLPTVRHAAVIAALFLAATPSVLVARPKTSEPLEQQLLQEGSAALAGAAQAQGDPVRGAVLFYQQQLSCTKCHACGGKDGQSPLGPDLARPVAGATAAGVVESLLAPSKVIRKGYETVIVIRSDGTTVTGLLVEERQDALALHDPAAMGKLVVIPKDDIEQRSTLFDHSTLRVAAGWTGVGFIDWNGINFNGRHEVHPRVIGTVAFETADGPGWADPETGSFVDPRMKGRDGKPYGPLPRAWGRYLGLYHAGDRAVFSYTVGDTSVLESPGLAVPASVPVFTRAFEVGPRTRVMTLRALRHPAGKAGVAGLVVQRDDTTSFATFAAGDKKLPRAVAGIVCEPRGTEWSAADDGHLLLRLPAGNDSLRFAVWMAGVQAGGKPEDIGAEVAKDTPPVDLAALKQGGRRRWDQAITTKLERGKDDGPFAADTLRVPDKNPWAARLRLTGLDFLPGGTDLAACTWDGDVWQVSGLGLLQGSILHLAD